MLPEDQLRAVLPALPRITIHGPWSRTIGFHLLLGPPPGTPAGGPPQPLWPGGPPLSGARFTPRAGFGTVYLASDPQTALMEVQAVVQNPLLPPFTLRTQPWTVVSVDGVLLDVLDLTDPSIQTALGATRAELTGEWRVSQAYDGIAPTQILGRAAFECGAIVAFQSASARNPEHGTVVAVFADRLIQGRPSYLEVIDPNRRLVQRLP